MPCQSLDGFPDGIGKTGAEDVSVGGIGVIVGVFVGVLVDSGVWVEVGKLVSVGLGVSVGSGTNVLQDANAIDKTKSNIALLIIFIFPRSRFAAL